MVHPFVDGQQLYIELFFSAVGSENQRGRELEDEGESGVVGVCLANAKASIMLETHKQWKFPWLFRVYRRVYYPVMRGF